MVSAGDSQRALEVPPPAVASPLTSSEASLLDSKSLRYAPSHGQVPRLHFLATQEIVPTPFVGRSTFFDYVPAIT